VEEDQHADEQRTPLGAGQSVGGLEESGSHFTESL
jgi:hypothetical protein